MTQIRLTVSTLFYSKQCVMMPIRAILRPTEIPNCPLLMCSETLETENYFFYRPLACLFAFTIVAGKIPAQQRLTVSRIPNFKKSIKKKYMKSAENSLTVHKNQGTQ